MANILYFSDICPDTGPMVAELKRLGFSYVEANISTSMANLKGFLRLRDSEKIFNRHSRPGAGKRRGNPRLAAAQGFSGLKMRSAYNERFF